MAANAKRVKRYIIDVNSFISVFINRETDWLLQYVTTNKIEIFVDDNLIVELSRVLTYPKIRRHLPLAPIVYVSFVRLISTHILSNNFNISSPDPEDDYLYNLALSAHAKLLVTGEKALLNWKESPVETITLSTFKQLF